MAVSLETGCSRHSINNRAAFTTYQDFAQPRSVSGLEGSIQAKGCGTAVYVCFNPPTTTDTAFLNGIIDNDITSRNQIPLMTALKEFVS